PTTVLGIAVHNAVAAVAGTVADVFSLGFDTLKRRFNSAPVTVPALARDAAVVTITRAAAALDQARRQAGGAEPPAPANLRSAARDIRARARDLAYAGQIGSRVDQDTYAADETVVAAGFAGAWRKAMDQLLAINGIAGDVAAAFYGLTRFTAQVLPPNLDAVSVRAEQALTGEVVAYVRRSALIYWAAALTRVTFATSQDVAVA